MANELISIERLENFHDDMTVDAHILKRSTAYEVDDKVNKGLIYLKCTQAGTTASTALSLSGVSVGDTLTDGTVTWKVLSIKGVPEGGGTGAGLEDWESNHDYAVDDIYVYEGEIYKTLIAFTSGVTEDSRTKVNNIVPSVWTANTAYTAGDIIEHTDVTTLKKVYYNVTSNFTSGATFEVTAEMDELQITEEYVPNPLTHTQVQNLINNFVPSGSGTDPIFYNDSPIGTIIAYMGITAPKDYLACDGQTYNIVDYKELAEYIKTQFGSYNYFGGNGTTTFAVPDLRGEFLRGSGVNSHANQGSGANVGVHQDSTKHLYLGKNAHNNSEQRLWFQSNLPDSENLVRPENIDGYFSNGATIGVAWTPGSTFDATGTTHYTSRPTNTSVLYCIKYTTSVLSTPENNYSTEEQRIGTWIDGKPLYQKTFVGITPSTANTNTNIFIDSILQNIDMCHITDGYIILDNGIYGIDFYNINESKETNYTSRIWISGSESSIRGSVGSKFISCSIVVTIQYTKTTD